MSSRAQEIVSAVIGFSLTIALVAGGLWLYRNGWDSALEQAAHWRARILPSAEQSASPESAPSDGAASPVVAKEGRESSRSEPPLEVEVDGDLDTPSFPETTVFRFTDEGGNLRFVTGLGNVPPRYRDTMSVVDGSKLSTYKPVRAAASARSETATTAGMGRAPGGEWNEAQITWMPFASRVSTARRLGKPVLLVVYTKWCRVCEKYKQVFRDPEVVALSQRFVMVKVDSDDESEADALYAPDGRYIPRTLFLDKTGRLDPGITASGNAEHKYVYNASDPASLQSGMKRALKQLD